MDVDMDVSESPMSMEVTAQTVGQSHEANLNAVPEGSGSWTLMAVLKHGKIQELLVFLILSKLDVHSLLSFYNAVGGLDDAHVPFFISLCVKAAADALCGFMPTYQMFMNEATPEDDRREIFHLCFMSVPLLIPGRFNVKYFKPFIPLNFRSRHGDQGFPVEQTDDPENQIDNPDKYCDGVWKRAKFFIEEVLSCLRNGCLNNLIVYGGFSNLCNRLDLIDILEYIIQNASMYFVQGNIKRASALVKLLRHSFQHYDIDRHPIKYMGETVCYDGIPRCKILFSVNDNGRLHTVYPTNAFLVCAEYYDANDPSKPKRLHGNQLSLNLDDIRIYNSNVEGKDMFFVYENRTQRLLGNSAPLSQALHS